MTPTNGAQGNSRWLEALIAPAELVAEATRSENPPLEAGLALLRELQLVTYERLATEQGWPQLTADEKPETTTGGVALLAAVGHELAGRDEAREELAALTSAAQAELALVATILAASAYASGDDLVRARQLLNERLAQTDNALARQLLLIHLGLRAAEDDDIVAAIEWTREACRGQSSESQLARPLMVVASWNLWRFEHILPPAEWTASHDTLPLRTSDPHLLRTELLLADGLDDYLKAEFESVLANPYERRIVWRAQDPVERGLIAGLLHAEGLGDWNGLGVARRSLGRYRVLVGVGRSDEALADAFDLLRRAGDDKSLGSSARMIVRVGPLGSLRSAVVATVTAPWSRIDRAARLALLANAADLLGPDEAATAFERVLVPELFVPLAPAADKAAAALLSVLDAARHSHAADLLLKLASDFPEPLVLQSLARVLRFMSWSDVDPGSRGQWLEYVRRHFGQGGDESLLAEAAAVHLAPSEPDAIAAVVRGAWAKRPALGTVAVFLDGNVELPKDVGTGAIELAVASLLEIREAAANGTYGFSTLSVPLLLFSLLQQINNEHAWQELADFLLDPLVGMADKTRTLDAMADDQTRVNFTAATALKPHLASLEAFADELGASGDAFRASALRLALKLQDGADGAQVLAELSRLAASDNAFARVQAGMTLPRAADLIGPQVAVTLTLGLTNDRHPDVRAWAARALASRFADVDEPLKTAVHERLRALLADAGTLVPQGVIAGLAEAHRAGRDVPQDVLGIVAQIRSDHPSYGVRHNAVTLFQQLAS